MSINSEKKTDAFFGYSSGNFLVSRRGKWITAIALFFIVIAGWKVWDWATRVEEAQALNKISNYGFESSAEPGTSWTAGGTMQTVTENSFTRIATSSAEGSYSFYAMWTGGNSNQQLWRGINQSFTPSATLSVIGGRMRYMRFCGGGNNPDNATMYLDLGTGTATTTLFTIANGNNACGTAQKDTTWQTSAWAATTTVSASTQYYLTVRWTAQLDTGEFYGAVIDYIELNFAPMNLAASSPSATSSAYLSWTASTGGPGLNVTTPYHIYRGAASTTLAYYANATTTGANFTDNNTTGNTTYYYAVADVDTASIESPTSSAVGVLTRPGKPGTPTYSGVGQTSITVNWNAPGGGATSYKIERATSTPDTWDEIKTGTSSGWADNTVYCGTTYYYRVRGTNASGDGEYSGSSSQATSACPTVPGKPGTPYFSSVGANTITVNWDPATGADTYKVERATSSPSGWDEIKTGTTSGWIDTTVYANTTYYYRVRGTNGVGDGEYSDASAAVLTLPGTPGTPTYSGVGETSITVIWDAPTGGATSYKVERATSSPSGWDEIKTGTTSPWADNTVYCETTYYYRVRGTNATGDGGYSDSSSQATSACTTGPVTTGSGPIAWWTLDATDSYGSTFFDKSGHWFNATSTASPGFVTGKKKQAISLNGSSQYLTATSSPFNFGTGDFTASAWIKPNNAALTYSIFDKYNTNSADDRGWFIFEAGNVIKASIDNGSIDITGTVPIQNGIWYHVVLVRNGANAYTYVNGVQDGTAGSLSARSASSAALLYIGVEKGSSQFFNGSIDDVRIYDRALAVNEIRTLYGDTSYKFINTPTKAGLVGYWTMDAGDMNGTNYYDKSGSNNTATSTGSPTIVAGKINQAVSLNGAQYLTAPITPFNFGTGNFTASVWAKFNSLANYRTLLNKFSSSAGGEAGFLLSTLIGTGNVMAYFGSAASYVTGATALQTGTWYHIAMVRNGDNGYLYLNGVQDGSQTGLAARNCSSSRVLEIGSELYDYLMVGSIDDVRIYNRALSATEVSQLYSGAKVTHMTN